MQTARAFVNHPQVLLLDEPTTGLDVSVQARILDLLRRLQRGTRVAMMVVDHDLAVVRMLADRPLVMREGRVVESGADRSGAVGCTASIHAASRLVAAGA